MANTSTVLKNSFLSRLSVWVKQTFAALYCVQLVHLQCQTSPKEWGGCQLRSHPWRYLCTPPPGWCLALGGPKESTISPFLQSASVESSRGLRAGLVSKSTVGPAEAAACGAGSLLGEAPQTLCGVHNEGLNIHYHLYLHKKWLALPGNHTSRDPTSLAFCLPTSWRVWTIIKSASSPGT